MQLNLNMTSLSCLICLGYHCQRRMTFILPSSKQVPRDKIMGTNYYLIEKEELIEQEERQAQQDARKRPSDQDDDIQDDEYMDVRKNLDDADVFHLGKSSGGWLFSWSMRGLQKMLNKLEIKGPECEAIEEALQMMYTGVNHTFKPCPPEVLQGSWTVDVVQTIILRLLASGYVIVNEYHQEKSFDEFWNHVAFNRGPANLLNGYRYATDPQYTRDNHRDWKTDLYRREFKIVGDKAKGQEDIYFSSCAGSFS